MAFCRHCFGSTERLLSIINYLGTLCTINGTQYIVIAFHECGLLNSYACHKIGQIGQIV